MKCSRISRRRLLTVVAGGTVGAAISPAALAIRNTGLVAGIDRVILHRGGNGNGPTWFHPRACMVPEATPSDTGSHSDRSVALAFMTLQPIGGSDYFGPVHWMTSHDLGNTWTEPQLVPPLGRVPQPGGGEEGVCDVVPQWHAPSRTVLALGHNVYYRGPRFSADQPPRWPVYAVWSNGYWSDRRKLEWPDPRGAYIYTNNCGQRVVLPNGDIVLALSYGRARNRPRSVSGVICAFDGQQLTVKEVGDEMTHHQGRGLLEPSIVHWQGRFYMTLRRR